VPPRWRTGSAPGYEGGSRRGKNGQRLPDLRRLVRQYGRTDDKVFPTGTYFKGGNYGTDENFPVPSSEQVNPLFHGCLDRKA